MSEGDNKIGSLIALAMISLKSSSVFSIKGTTKSIHTFNGRILKHSLLLLFCLLTPLLFKAFSLPLHL